MRIPLCSRSKWVLHLLLVAMVAGLVPIARADTWRGTAPFCNGKCLKGERNAGTSDYGDGGYCVTGHKVLCTNAQAQCRANETLARCYGVVEICENGYQEQLNQVWHTCNTYGCGVCIGSGVVSAVSHIQSANGGGAGYVSSRCRAGYVWREAVKGDVVCVSPATREQAHQDNLAAAGRKVSGSDSCKQGFVWREVTPGDHVCVAPATRTAVRNDNNQAATRVAPAPTSVFNDTCARGFVWREAIKDDHVCVTPATREAARNDNAQGESRIAQGASPPDSCKNGFVWREVVPSDHVCVAPQARSQAAIDNSLAPTRLTPR